MRPTADLKFEIAGWLRCVAAMTPAERDLILEDDTIEWELARRVEPPPYLDLFAYATREEPAPPPDADAAAAAMAAVDDPDPRYTPTQHADRARILRAVASGIPLFDETRLTEFLVADGVDPSLIDPMFPAATLAGLVFWVQYCVGVDCWRVYDVMSESCDLFATEAEAHADLALLSSRIVNGEYEPPHDPLAFDGAHLLGISPERIKFIEGVNRMVRAGMHDADEIHAALRAEGIENPRDAP